MTIECECKAKAIPEHLWCGKECHRHAATIANIRQLIVSLPDAAPFAPFILPSFHGQFLKGKTNDNA